MVSIMVPQVLCNEENEVVNLPRRKSLLESATDWLESWRQPAPKILSKGAVAFHRNRRVFAACRRESGDIYIFCEDRWLFPPLSHAYQDAAVNCVSWAALTDTLLVGTKDALCAWNLCGLSSGTSDHSWMTALRQPGGRSVDLIKPLPSGKLVATACLSDGSVYLWDGLLQEPSLIISLRGSICRELAWTPSGSHLISGAR